MKTVFLKRVEKYKIFQKIVTWLMNNKKKVQTRVVNSKIFKYRTP